MKIGSYLANVNDMVVGMENTIGSTKVGAGQVHRWYSGDQACSYPSDLSSKELFLVTLSEGFL